MVAGTHPEMGKIADWSLRYVVWCGMDEGQMVTETGYGRLRELLDEGDRGMEVTS